MEPVPTSMDPDLRPLPGIRAVAFDVYGTLFISGSGDIGLASDAANERHARAALQSCGLCLPADAGVSVSALFHEAISGQHQRGRAAGTAFPEVDVREIWAEVLDGLAARGVIAAGLDTAGLERLAGEYEWRLNPVWPMPGFDVVMRSLRRAGLPAGIVSNAQFYTPAMIEALAGASLAQLGFKADLCFYSYQSREGKPSTLLYHRLLRGLAARGIVPQDCLYIGNDIRNDIAPAASLGLRTALFAGDARSLRLRRDDPACAGVQPDRVLTALDQLPALLQLAPVTSSR